jgi:acetyl esterase
MARDKGGPALKAQVLINPAVDLAGWDKKGFPLEFKYFRGHYLKEQTDAADPYASPLRAARHDRLPPALVVAGETDPLRDEGEAYAAKLREAGVRANAYRNHGRGHLGPAFAAAAPPAEEALDVTVAFLRAALGKAK